LTLKILAHFGLGEEWIEFVPDRPGHDFRYALDSSKVRQLGFRPRHSFDEAMAETVAWYRNHPEWWQPLRKDKFTLKGV
jgi:dTDP-glucose 4,6-dehydratase